MSKLEKMIKEYNAAIAGKDNLVEEVKRLRADKDHLTNEAEAAAKAGNVEEYKEKKNAAELAADTLFVREKQIEGLNCLRTEGEAKAAWSEFAKDYNASFSKAWKAYEAKRKDLFEEFTKLVDMQNEMLKKRKACGGCCGLDAGNYPLSNQLDSAFPISLLPSTMPTNKPRPQIESPDTKYYILTDLANEKDTSVYNSVIRLHIPFEE